MNVDGISAASLNVGNSSCIVLGILACSIRYVFNLDGTPQSFINVNATL